MIAPNNENKKQPQPKGGKGGEVRKPNGQFGIGHCGGPGNSQNKRVAEFRKAMLEAITPENVRNAVGKLVLHAEAGEEWAIRELLDRAVGKCKPADDGDTGPVRIVVVNNDQWNRNRIAASEFA